MSTENKNTDVIPKGLYCYTLHPTEKNNAGFPKVIPCPYWSRREDKPAQENGYCSFLGEGDWEDEGFSLLWDMCKECGENLDDDEEEEAEAKETSSNITH